MFQEYLLSCCLHEIFVCTNLVKQILSMWIFFCDTEIFVGNVKISVDDMEMFVNKHVCNVEMCVCTNLGNFCSTVGRCLLSVVVNVVTQEFRSSGSQCVKC